MNQPRLSVIWFVIVFMTIINTLIFFLKSLIQASQNNYEIVLNKVVFKILDNYYSTTMGVRYKLPFTVVNLSIHGWLTHALVEHHDRLFSRFFIVLPGKLAEQGFLISPNEFI